MYIPLSDYKHQMVRDSSKNALASADVIVTQLLRYHMPLLYCMQPFNNLGKLNQISDQNVTDLEQRVEVLEVEVANMEDDINDVETDVVIIQDGVSQNTKQIFGIIICFI